MSYFNWTTIKQKVERDLMTEDELWVDEDELIGYANEAIRDCEALIHGLYEDYFLTYTPITFTAGQEKVDLPDDIYAFKIRRFLFEKDATRYPIQRIKDWYKFENKSLSDYNQGETRYQYFLTNSLDDGDAKILLSPVIRGEDAGTYGKLYYIRNVRQLTITGNDTCDIPEFINFIYAHMKTNIYAKEMHPNLAREDAKLIKQKELLEGTLATMIPDADNEIEPDFDLYEEMS